MKHLFVIPFEPSFTVPNRLFMTLEGALYQKEQGNEVALLYCDGKSTNFCWVNTKCDKQMCRICNRYRKLFFKTLPKEIKYLPTSEFYKHATQDYASMKFNYTNNSELKALYYKGVGIGYAALSSYISQTRNLYPLMDEEFHNHLDPILASIIQVTDIFIAALDHTKPECVGTFNTRFVVSRPIFDICQDRGVNVIVYEPGPVYPEGRCWIPYENTLPHNIEYNNRLIAQVWNSEKHPKEEKIKIAEDFFHNRKNAIAAGDKVYVKDQRKGLLPDNWDNNKHNIVIFNSSEDEFAALGEEYENNLYPSQYHGIKDIFERYKNLDDYHFYLRIHPNLKDIPYSYHKKLYELDNICNNVTVISGDSPISTYALMDAAEKIIVFGSSTGLEAVYWGKPVILLSKCIYSYLDICYCPTSTQELDNLIVSDLSPKDKEPTLAIAYFRLCDELPEFKYFPYKLKRYRLFGKMFDVHELNVSNHRWLKFRSTIVRLIGTARRHFKYTSIKPTKENPNAII